MLPTLLAVIALSARTPSSDEIASWHNSVQAPARVGSKAWTREFPAAAEQSGSIATKRAIIVFTPEGLYGLLPSDGRQLWKSDVDFGKQMPQLAADFGKTAVFAGWSREDAVLFGLDTTSGRLRWRTDLRRASTRFLTSGPLLICKIQHRERYFQYEGLVLIDSRSGGITGELSPANEAGNIGILKRVAPELVDQLLVFEGDVVRNGVLVQSEYFGASPRTMIWDGSVYSWLQYEEYYELEHLSALCGVRKYGLESYRRGGPPREDLWKGKAMGRAYRSRPAHYYERILGIYQGNLLSQYVKTVERGDNFVQITTLVTLPARGSAVATPVATSPGRLIPFPKCWTQLGFLFAIQTESPGRDEKIVLLRDDKLITQPSPKSLTSPDMVQWQVDEQCEHGLIYRSYSKIIGTDPASRGKQMIHLEPYRVK